MSDYINKTINKTIVSCFKMENNELAAFDFEYMGSIDSMEQASKVASKQFGNVLVSAFEVKSVTYRLAKSVAREYATSERESRDDIMIGRTYTYVRAWKLVSPDSHDGKLAEDIIILDGAMTEARAFGSARRACEYDILPYEAWQSRDVAFIARDKFYELAEIVDE